MSVVRLLKIAAKIASSLFDLNQFKQIQDLNGCFEYVKSKGFKKIGEGGSREVFEIPSEDQCIKICKPSMPLGVAQNKAEYEISQQKDLPIAGVVHHDPHFKWIIMERVTPLSSEIEYFKLGIQDCIDIASDVEEGNLERANEIYQELETEEQRELVHKIIKLMKVGVRCSDLYSFNHWGRNSHGELVVLDYGVTKSVFDKLIKR